MNVYSVNAFINQIDNLPKDPGFTYFYRGHADSSYLLEPSIYRDDGYLENEHVFYREFVARNPNNFTDCKYAIDYLVMMQHYELPTRLLDLTTNPLIALFFACHTLSDTKGINLTKGEVIVFKIPNDEIKYYDSDTVSVIANISKINSDFYYKAYRNTKRFNDKACIQLLKHEIGMEKPHFQPIIKSDHLKSVVCVKTKRSNPRIQNQSGPFLLFGVQGKAKKMASLKSQWLHCGNSLMICSPKDILNQLAVIGIDGSFVYPEMQNYAKVLKGNSFIGKKTHV